MIKFGMGNTLLTFVDKYYEYSGDLDIKDRGLTIGVYESAWLADLCMAYVMDNSRDILDNLIYDGIYRDDGIAVFKGSKTTGEIANWLNTFQNRVNNLAGSEFLEFTAEVWGNNKDDCRKHRAVDATNKDYFPFLDMVYGRQSTIQSAPEREPNVKISQSRQYTHQSMFRSHPHWSHEKTGIPYNQNRYV
jgi:hypothetical protein